MKEPSKFKQTEIEMIPEKYEKIQEENAQLLKEFEESLIKRNLSRKTIKSHINNVDLFINQYLAIDEEERPNELEEYTLDCFFRWCIDKWVFNASSGLLSAISSIRLFYEYLNGKEHMPNIGGIIGVCAKKDYYVKKFNSHERLLNR